jgi:hypothetical protein
VAPITLVLRAPALHFSDGVYHDPGVPFVHEQAQICISGELPASSSVTNATIRDHSLQVWHSSLADWYFDISSCAADPQRLREPRIFRSTVAGLVQATFPACNPVRTPVPARLWSIVCAIGSVTVDV